MADWLVKKAMFWTGTFRCFGSCVLRQGKYHFVCEWCATTLEEMEESYPVCWVCGHKQTDLPFVEYGLRLMREGWKAWGVLDKERWGNYPQSDWGPADPHAFYILVSAYTDPMREREEREVWKRESQELGDEGPRSDHPAQ